MSIFVELKRRNVFRVGVAYIVAAWLIAQVMQVATESFEAPAWIMKMLITVLAIGLPVVLFFSWAYEITPEGIKRESEVSREASITHKTARKLDLLTMGLLLAVVAIIVVDRYVIERPAAPAEASSAAQDSADDDGEATDMVKQNSIAVLPFVNMSNDPEQEYFSDGIAEELLNLLVGVEGLEVASRTSSFAYKGDDTGIPEIARALKVANVLEGSVRKAGNRIRITAQLIDTRNDRHLWSDSYDRELTDIFAIQDEIANAIVNALRTELGLDIEADAVAVVADTENLDAYDLFLKAHGLLIARRDLDQAVLMLERAVEMDPNFVRAWADLGAAAYVAPAWNFVDRDYHSIAIRATERALELDNDQSMVWAVRSRLSLLKKNGSDYIAGIRYLDTAIEKDPKNSTAWLWRGVSFSELGFHDRALADVEKCLEIDPAYSNCLLHAAIIHVLTGNHEGVLATYSEMARTDFLTYQAIHVPYMVRRGEQLGAILAAYHVSRHPEFPAREWIYALQHPGGDYSKNVAQAEQWLSHETRIGMHAALMLAFGAWERLKIEEALVSNWIWANEVPGFRGSADFKRLVRELNLEEYWRDNEFPPQCRPLGAEDFECE